MRQVCNFTSERVSPSEGLIGSHILWYQGWNLLIGLKYSNGQVGALENVSITKRARPLCWRRKARIVAARAISSFRPLSFSFLSLSAFYDSFLFIVEPESLVHNGPVRGMRAWNRCSSHPLRPSIRVSLLLSSLPPVENRVSTNDDEWERERERDEKSTLRLPSLFVKSFFPAHSYREMSIFRRISIQRPFRSAPLPISPPG